MRKIKGDKMKVHYKHERHPRYPKSACGIQHLTATYTNDIKKVTCQMCIISYNKQQGEKK